MALREITDEVMYDIAQLSGYEYRDTYATRKAEDVPSEVAHIARPDLAAAGRIADLTLEDAPADLTVDVVLAPTS